METFNSNSLRQNSGGTAPSDSLSLNFEKVVIVYTRQAPDEVEILSYSWGSTSGATF